MNMVSPAAVPIVVDLDGSLILTDTLHEQLVRAVFHHPLTLLRSLPAMLRGRLAFKATLSAMAPLDAETLPLRVDLVAWLDTQRALGRHVHLATAAHQSIADSIASRLPWLASAIGSNSVNLKGPAKAARLQGAFPGGFTYVGDSAADLAVWPAATAIVLAGASPATARAARALGKPVEAEFLAEPAGRFGQWRDWVRAMRVHHWSKNVLLLLPLVLGHAWSDHGAILNTLAGLVLLLAVTSSTYLLNDLADLESDRLHWSKRLRPIASGRIPALTALVAGAAGIVLAVGLALLFSPALAATLAAYVGLTLAYSFGLKRVPLLDTMIIGLLFTLRIAMGVAVLHQPYPQWLLTFAAFFFSSLALAKRHTEILRAGTLGRASLASRGYVPEDAALTLALGVGAAIASLVIMTLYLTEDAFHSITYEHTGWLWGIPMLLAIWIGRIWLLAHRGRLLDDPVSFALRDRPSLALGGAGLVAFLLAL